MKVRKIPQRMCSGCKEHKPKKELVRIVRSPGGEILLDLVGKVSGRGAYICRKLECLQLARKAKRLERSLECAIPAQIYERLEEELKQSEG